ncbi:hypothetical protein IEG05_19630 [Pseudomonas kunmingensis]|uniref:hypothetical protein n=1 Tax=Stutzerimonas kunmingensis TaxID=1211807 RepID=UPI001745CC90|nr:hypothetical protein [Stutzerimonas kunmingensis]MBD3877420.1 hypothetical protein [Stutzerimonas kunmingensis]
MTRTNKIIIAIAGLLGAVTYVRYDVWALELAHRNASRDAECVIKRADGERWAACKFGSGGSLWVQHEKGWAATNGKAKQLAETLAQRGNKGGATLYSKGGEGRIPPAKLIELL